MRKKIVVPKFRFHFKNRTGLIAIGLSLVLLLSACGGTAPQRGRGGIPAQVRIDVAGTLTAQPTATATLTETPTPTPTGTPTETLTPTPSIFLHTFLTCNNLEFLSDRTISDGTILAPGEKFTKTWGVENIGSCAWAPVYSLRFISGNRMGGLKTSIGQSVNPNGIADISVALTAPDHEGTYVGFWRLTDQYGKTFGETLELEIVVEQAALTPAPTATATATLISFGAPAAGGGSTVATSTSAVPAGSTPVATATPTP